ncbi:ankyrin repeat domain-containing protein [Wolbachia endosymbiont (group A) of Longitarsus flavicornis]|uniref:ankyrin repeat domain-containing protein n=1 Tax=Wolbachia endosymbiont (group A) of Longitarsus flavicornis TaxID=3066134 RepID=UPI0030CA5797
MGKFHWSTLLNAEDDKEETPLDLTTNEEIKTLLQSTAQLLKAAAEKGHEEEVQALLEKGANVNATDQNGKTPLHSAARNNNKEVVEALLQVNGININAQDRDNMTPLHWAAVKGHKEAVEALLGKDGIDVNLADKNKDTPLHSVLKKDNIDINVLNALLGEEGIDVNAQDGLNNTPLHLAVKKDNIDINVLNALLGAEGIDVNIKDKLREWTPLHWAVSENKIDKVKALLGAEGIDVNIEDKYEKKTPLHLAAQNNNQEIVEDLIKAGANINVKDKDEKTPLDLATDEKIKTLLQPAEESDPVDGSSTESEGGQEEEKRVGDDTELQSDNSKEGEKTSTTSAEQGTGVSNGSQPTGSTQNKGGQTSTTSAEQGTDVQDNDVGPVASTEPAQTEEQPSSFFGSLFSILMKPFSLVASFFGGFFSWLFGSDEEKSDTQPYDDSSSPGVDQSVEQNNGDHNDQSNVI